MGGITMNEKFNPKTFQPFDKVLARCTESVWVPTLFGYFIDEADKDPLSPFENGERVVCVDIGYHQCIPYNDETKKKTKIKFHNDYTLYQLSKAHCP